MRPAAIKCILLLAFPSKIAEIVKLIAIKFEKIGQIFFPEWQFDFSDVARVASVASVVGIIDIADVIDVIDNVEFSENMWQMLTLG